jgi:ABC-type multidrug transport system fused ATPase/permease subunit
MKNEIKYKVRLALQEHQQFNVELLNESMIVENFLSSAKEMVGNAWDKGVKTITNAKDLAYVFGKVSSNDDLAKTTSDYFFKYFKRTTLKDLYDKLTSLKLVDVKEKVEALISKIENGNYSDKIKFLLGSVVGSIVLYLKTYIDKLATQKDGIDKIKSFALKFLSVIVISEIISSLTNISGYFGLITKIVGGIAILIQLLKPISDVIIDYINRGSKYFLAKENIDYSSNLSNPMCNIMTVNTYEEGIAYLNQYIGTPEENPEAWAQIVEPLEMWKDITIQIRKELKTGATGDSEADESNTWWSAIISRFCR